MPRRGAAPAARGASMAVSAPSARGKYTVNDVPLPTSLWTLTLPPLRRAMPCTVARPSPVPLPGPLVVKNGSKTRACTSGVMPVPVSVTESAT